MAHTENTYSSVVEWCTLSMSTGSCLFVAGIELIEFLYIIAYFCLDDISVIKRETL